MNRSALAWFAVSWLLVMGVGLGALALADTNIVLGRYPNAALRSTDVHQVQGRLIQQNNTYETGDPLNVVADWYSAHYHVALDHDLVIQRPCVRLASSGGVSLLRQSVVVSLCAAGGGTLIYFDRAVYLGQ